MAQIRVTVHEAWQEEDADGRPVFRSALLTTLMVDDAGSIDQNRAAAANAVRGATGGRAPTLSFTTPSTISATVRRATPPPGP
jgi:hypothetical protein